MTSDRQPRSVNFDKDNLEWMDDNIGNRSEFINDLIHQYRQGTSEMNDAVARFRLEQLASQEASLETRLESIRSEKNSVREKLNVAEEIKESELEDARVNLKGTPHDPSNPAIQKWAEKVGVTAPELIEELEDE